MAVLMVGCGSSDTAEVATDSDAVVVDVETGLAGCVSNIADDVPAFYSTYFRCTDISIDGDVVVITGSNLPPHYSYYWGTDNALYEEFDYSRGDQYRPNPNEIATAQFTLRIPLNPTPTGISVDDTTVNADTGDNTDYPLGTAGVAIDGVSLFNSLAAPGADIIDERFTFDSNEGHPQDRGVYHYHAVTHGPLTVLQSLGITTTNVPGEAEIELYGMMCDGTVVLGYSELDGTENGGDLDAQGGHAHDIVDVDGTTLLEDRYHIHMYPEIGFEPRGLTPEAQYYSTCDV